MIVRHTYGELKRRIVLQVGRFAVIISTAFFASPDGSHNVIKNPAWYTKARKPRVDDGLATLRSPAHFGKVQPVTGRIGHSKA